MGLQEYRKAQRRVGKTSLSFHMKSLLILLSVLLFYSPRLHAQSPEQDPPFKYPLKSISSFCIHDTNNFRFRTVLSYDSLHRLTRSSYFIGDLETERDLYHYNETGLLESRSSYTRDTTLKPSGIRIYEYDQERRLVYEHDQSNRSNAFHKKYFYDKTGRLNTITIQYGSKGPVTTYFFDKKNRLTAINNGGHLVNSFRYRKKNGDKVVRKDQHESEIILQYNAQGLLLSKKVPEGFTEENVYSDGKLVRRWTREFGSDCFDSACCSKYFLKFEYY